MKVILKQTLEEKNLTLRKACRKVGVLYYPVYAVLSGDRKNPQDSVNFANACKVLNHLGLDPDQYFSER